MVESARDVDLSTVPDFLSAAPTEGSPHQTPRPEVSIKSTIRICDCRPHGQPSPRHRSRTFYLQPPRMAASQTPRREMSIESTNRIFSCRPHGQPISRHTIIPSRGWNRSRIFTANPSTDMPETKVPDIHGQPIIWHVTMPLGVPGRLLHYVGVEAFVPSCNATLRGLPDQNNGRRPSASRQQTTWRASSAVPRLPPVTAVPKARARFRWNRSRVFYYVASTINLVVQWSSCAVLRHTRWVASPWVCDRQSACRQTANSQSMPEQNLNPKRIVNRRILTPKTSVLTVSPRKRSLVDSAPIYFTVHKQRSKHENKTAD